MAALSIGAGLPAAEFSGTVVATFHRVCAFALPDDNLLTLVAPEIGRLPRSICIDAPAALEFESAFPIGAHLGARAGIIRLSTGRLTIDIRSATCWTSPLKSLRVDGANPRVMNALRTARAALEEDRRNANFVRAAGSRLTGIVATTRALDAAGATNAVSQLVGLGEGATPAGDDFLVGYLAGLWACADRNGRRLGFAKAIAGQIKSFARATSNTSRAYLEAAADGEVSDRIYVLAEQVASGSDSATVLRATNRVLSVGHSSGACGLHGFLEACLCWAAAVPSEG